MITLPKDVPEYMAPAWFGLLRWAIGNAEIRKQFEADTGIPPLATGGINRLIDEATGLPEKYMTDFAAWAHENLWGSTEEESTDAN